MERDSPRELMFERSYYIGGQITLILYGIHLVAFFVSVHLLLDARKRGKASGSTFYISYGSALVVLWTIALSCNAYFAQLMWIEERHVPGGPAAYLHQHISDWINTFGTASALAMNFLADSLLLYRCFIIWNTWKVIAFPFIMLLGVIALSIISCYEAALPGANFFRGKAVAFGVPYAALTISLNVLVTSLICFRLLYLRRKVEKVLGPDMAKEYTGVIAIMVESALPFTLLGIGYVVTYGTNHPSSFAWVQVWGDFLALSPQLIILRVAMGKAWVRDTASWISESEMEFTRNHISRSDAVSSTVASTARDTEKYQMGSIASSKSNV